MQSATERGHVSVVEERPHPFVGDSPLEFGVGIFVGREEFVPNYGRGGGIDHFKRPFGFVLKADDGTSTVTPSCFTVRESPDWTIFGSRSIIAASKFGAVLFGGARVF